MLERTATAVVCAGLLFLGRGVPFADGAELLVGAATTSITPSEPVALMGQMHTRVARQVESPVTATALALEARQGDQVVDQAVMVSCDLAAICGNIQQRLRERLKGKLAGFDLRKLFLNATHTHTAPVMLEAQYAIPTEGVMQPSAYVEFLLDRVSGLVIEAWTSRKPGGVSWGLGHAVVAHNRRAVYADGSAEMYGKTNLPTFRGIEGYEDHGVEVLFFWDREKTLVATAINVACPAQEVEVRSTINADYWHEVREQLRARYGQALCVLGWIGAAGDQSPHVRFRNQAEARMRKLRGLTGLQEIARRIVRAVVDVHDATRNEIHTDVLFLHHVQDIDLPIRRVTDKELATATSAVKDLIAQKKHGKDVRRRKIWHQETVDRYERQKDGRPYRMELHAIRLGDVAICTNPFELFTEYGIRIKARSKALQTFVIQLTGASGMYLPTAEAVRGGGYSAEINSNLVGPAGGNMLVDRTVEAVNALWDAH